MKILDRLKLFVTPANKANDYLLEFNYTVEPGYNAKKVITTVLAEGYFKDRRTGHVETEKIGFALNNSEILYTVGPDIDDIKQSFQELAKKKLSEGNFLQLARKSINTALAIEAAIVAGVIAGVTICALIWF